MKKIYLTIVILFILFTTGIAPATRKGNYLEPEAAWALYKKKKIAGIDSLVLHFHNRYNFSGNVLVSDHGHIIYNSSFINNKLKAKENLTRKSVFQLASVSKQFTAMAIMILERRYLLEYSDTITSYLPDLPWNNVTIKQLLRHTGGLPNYMWLIENYWDKAYPPSNDEVIDLISKYKNKMNLYFFPGTRFNYSNTGYMLLASIVEKVSGISYAEFIEKNIFQKLNMNDSFVYQPSANKEEKGVSGYRPYGRSYLKIPETVNDGVVGDKGIFSTTYDMYLWDKALYTEKLVPAELIDSAFTTFKLRGKYTIHYNFGFRIRERYDKKALYHYGKWNGFRTSIFRYPEEQSSIIILNNSSFYNVGGLQRRIEKILLSD